MKVTKLIVHCGRGTADWLIITHIDTVSYFNGFGKKKHATKFVSVEQANGAIKMHRIQQRMPRHYNKYKIFRIEVEE